MSCDREENRVRGIDPGDVKYLSKRSEESGVKCEYVLDGGLDSEGRGSTSQLR